jgi:hypothetical protein
MFLARSMLITTGLLVLAGTALTAREWDAQAPAFFLGLALLIVGALGLATCPLISRRYNLEHAYEAGYEAGYSRGRRVSKPQVVPIHAARTAAQKR